MENTARHAYLILAHDNFGMLQHLISLIDHPNNDIYIHIDKKSKVMPNLRVRYSMISILKKRVKVYWADFSVVEAELLLLREASSMHQYSYYHLLSGYDMPIVAQDIIHKFCIENYGLQFIGFDRHISNYELARRASYYTTFNKKWKSKNYIIRGMRKASTIAQKLLGIQRDISTIRKGSQWWSITHEMVQIVLMHEQEIRKRFTRTFAPDEMFVQTIYINSSLYQNSNDSESEGSKRYIKWHEGQLLPITHYDIPLMRDSNCWFARKFDQATMHFIDSLHT